MITKLVSKIERKSRNLIVQRVFNKVLNTSKFKRTLSNKRGISYCNIYPKQTGNVTSCFVTEMENMSGDVTRQLNMRFVHK